MSLSAKQAGILEDIADAQTKALALEIEQLELQAEQLNTEIAELTGEVDLAID